MYSPDLPEQARTTIETEEQILGQVYNSLDQQLEKSCQRFLTENDRARDLTASLVSTRRDEEKWQLASDEAVSHSVAGKIKADSKTIERLLKKPYFARVVVEEDRSGKPYQIEYKIGFAANTDCRIIDWRRAPLAKLYYEYREGDEYSEDIMGRERTGYIKLRNTLEIASRTIKKLSCSSGVFSSVDGKWVKSSQGQANSSAGRGLTDIVALITPEQFRMITEEATSAVLIQGIAGSGKTTVALHRLAWLLHEDNSDLKEEECLVLVLSKALKNFVANLLPTLGIFGVRLLTFQEWALETFKIYCPEVTDQQTTLRLASTPCPLGIERAKRSTAVLKALEIYAAKQRKDTSQSSSYLEELAEALSDHDLILANDQTRLIDRALLNAMQKRLLENFAEQRLDLNDIPLLLRLINLRLKGSLLKSGQIGLYRQIVCDEVQDLSAAELNCIVNAVEDLGQLTLVGDSAQALNTSTTFPGWEALCSLWKEKNLTPHFISLSISFRSTLQIMRLADHVQRRTLVTRGRNGRVPIWFRCRGESLGIKSVIEWLSRAIQRYPTALSAVICADQKEVKLALSFLEPSFGNLIRAGDQNTFSFEQGIVVTDVLSAKGLEFPNVLIWNPSAQNYPETDSAQNGLYIAITRAEENLAIVSWQKPASFLPNPSSALIRHVPVGFEQE